MATDTMRNTVYARAQAVDLRDPEVFGQDLAEHFLRASPGCREAIVSLRRRTWSAHGRRRRAASARVPARRRRRQPHRPRRRDRGRHARHRRHRRAHGAEDDRLRLRGLPARPLHHAAGDRRPHPRHRRARRVGLRDARRRLDARLGARPGHAARGLRDALQPLAAADALRDRRGDPRRRARHRRGAALPAQPPPPALRPRPLRHGPTSARSSTPSAEPYGLIEGTIRR